MAYRHFFCCVIIIGWAYVSCAHAPLKNSPSDDCPLTEYMPLFLGQRWVYETWFQSQAQPDVEVKLIKEENGYFFDDSKAPSPMRFDAHGLRHGTKRYVLKTPLKVGQKWMSVSDVRTVEHYEILSTSHKAVVPAGSFEKCIVVEMRVNINPQLSMSTRTTFAPGVGIVEIQTMLLKDGKTSPQAHYRLKEYGVQVGA